jgi:antitoxin (DNA-binding transcriptional repressor) of toxin-antitoxin stability system
MSNNESRQGADAVPPTMIPTDYLRLHLSDILSRVAEGEVFVVTRRGNVVCKIEPITVDEMWEMAR